MSPCSHRPVPPRKLAGRRRVAADGGGTLRGVLVTIVRIVIAIAVFMVILRLGLGLLRMLAAPVPEPPPPGELRKVKLTYRCPSCGAEVRMTSAASEEPEPPRHCMDDMELVANAYD